MNTQNLDKELQFSVDQQLDSNTIIIDNDTKAITIDNQPDVVYQTYNVNDVNKYLDLGFVEVTQEYDQRYFEILKVLETSNQASNAPFSFVLYGNVYGGNEQFVGAGNGRIGEPINQDMYIRYASLTKTIGMCLLAKALEDGLITSLDDPAWIYIPELATINSYVSSATLSGGSDAYGTPNYTMNTTVVPELGKQITIRQLLECKSGLGYSTFDFGYTRVQLNQIYQFYQFVIGFIPPTLANYVAWLQNLVGANPTAPIAFAETAHAAYFNNMQIFTQSIQQRVNYPLLYLPGTDSSYDVGMTWVGAAIGGALRNNMINKTAAEYCKEVLLDPLGMSTVWLNGGSLSPPVDVNSRITGAFFVRANNIDGQKGPNVNFNTIYRVNEPNADQDGYQRQAMNYYLLSKPVNAQLNDPYAGGFDWSGAGSISDYTKLIRMLMRKGKNEMGFKYSLKIVSIMLY